MFIGNLTQFFTYDTRTAVIDGSGVFYTNPSPRAAAMNSNMTTTTTAYTFNATSIPDNNLGWEINAGVDWKLLEHWTVRVLAGYWQPWRWFNYACVDKTVPNWNTLTTYPFGVNPDRAIDTIPRV
jgi:hypothetical protein